MTIHDGGWVIDPKINSHIHPMTSEQHSIFTHAFEGFCGAGYEPIAYLGKQVVSGMNHRYVALQTLAQPGEKKSAIVTVTLYVPLEGRAVITSIETI
ncbi:hypothetical protein [Siccibacter turicensis]|uniref:hypothetical protein n=1 Tax=Siccibacter turicensis TaxID=357233 RepID=UPI0023F420CC|nr:hypothetical protein [Siccibacter turicensis]